MADESDVENALVALVVAALYPNGSDRSSVPGPDCRVYRGWPTSASLDADLSSGRINVTVFPTNEPGRNTTRYRDDWVAVPAAPTLTATIDGWSVTVGGKAEPGQAVGLSICGNAYSYRTSIGDTPEVVAGQLANAVRSHWIVNLSGARLLIPGASRMVARVVTDANATRVIRRQERAFRITCWCPSPAMRDVTASAVDAVLGDLRFIPMDDGSQGHIRYDGTLVFDQSQDALLYRRDLIYQVEYPTTIKALQPAMLFGDLTVNSATFVA